MRFIRTAENLFGLPLGFQRVEYLQSSGTQYINTGVKATNKTKAIVKSVGMTWVFGGRTGLSYGDAFGVCLGQNEAYLQFGNQSITYSKTNIKNDIVLLENSQDGCYVNGVKQATYNAQTFTGTHNIYLFNLNDNDRLNDGLVGKIWFSKIYEDGVLVRDFVPCLDNNNVPCMYDKVTGQAYYNAGTGSFTYGRKIIPVEYLESTGTQWINTGIFPTNEMEFESKFTFTSLVSTNLTVIGSRDSTKRCQPIGAYNNKWSASIGGSYDANGSSVSANTSYVVKSIISNGQTITLTVNGNQASVCTSTTGLPNQELYIFGRNFYGNTDPVDSRVDAKMYFMKIKASNVLVRDFVPCKDENNVGFMFDKVSGTCYLNAGTGAFSVGENKYTSKLRLIKDAKELPTGYKRVDYLASSGSQYINTGVIPTNTHGISINFSFSSDESFDGSWCPIGARTGDIRFWINKSVEASGLTFGFGDFTTSRQTQPKNTLLKASLNLYNNRKMIYVNGNYQANITSSISNLSNALYLFGANVNGSISFIPPDCRIYSAQITEGSSLVRDFIPCIDPNGTPCMLDLVERKPYYNLGSGSFTYGHTITPVEYLESTGTQYIDTGYKPNSIYGVECNYALMSYESTSTIGSKAPWIFGCWDTDNTKSFLFRPTGATTQTRNLSFIFGNRIDATALSLYDFHTMSARDGILKSDGVNVGSYDRVSNSTTLNVWLFGLNQTDPMYAKVKIKAFKLYGSNGLIRDFIPVRDENNVGYMFDKVTGQLFGNAGSGSFAVGNDLPTANVRFIQDVIPSAYLPLKYLQSTGTQYIDTGVSGSNTLKVFVDVKGDDVEGGVWGCGNDLYSTDRFQVYLTSYFTARIDGTIVETTIPYNQRVSVLVDAPNQKVSFNGQEYTCSYSSALSSKKIWLFGRNIPYSGQLKGKIYQFKLWDNGTLVRDFYPALRKSDNKPGMYDRITKQFFVNQGTGEFNYEI